MAAPVFKAKINAFGHGEVSINDQDISNAVSGFEVRAKVGEITVVQVTLIGVELELELEGDVKQTAVGLRPARPASRTSIGGG